MNMKDFHARMQTAPFTAQAAWRMVEGSSRALLDALCAEWMATPMTTRVHVIQTFEEAGLVPILLRAHITEYATRNSHVLAGLGFALRAYREEAGVLLEVPSSAVAPNPNLHIIHLAAVAQLLEQDRVGRSDYHWLHDEVERLGRACLNWLEMERQRDEMGGWPRIEPSGSAGDADNRP